MPPKKRSAGPKKKKEVGVEGIVYIKATFNNTIVTITDMEGNTVVWGSPGKSGFRMTICLSFQQSIKRILAKRTKQKNKGTLI